MGLVRRAGPKDRAVVLAFHLALYRTHRDSVMPKGVKPLVDYRDLEVVLRDDVNAMLSDRETTVLLAIVDGAAVGYVTGHIEVDERRVARRRGIMGDWYVEESARGTGIGKALVTRLEEVFRADGCDTMESATWAFNKGARKAHAALGFHEVQIVYRKVLE
jgi:GNAT superfamily N-acetyltransferase